MVHKGRGSGSYSPIRNTPSERILRATADVIALRRGFVQVLRERNIRKFSLPALRGFLGLQILNADRPLGTRLVVLPGFGHFSAPISAAIRNSGSRRGATSRLEGEHLSQVPCFALYRFAGWRLTTPNW